jgi:invasion protein IalB
LLHRGISLDAGTAKPIVVPYETCGKGRCRAVASLAADYVETLMSSQKLTATIVTRDGQELALPLSVNGLADGLAALNTSTPAATDPPATAPPAN